MRDCERHVRLVFDCCDLRKDARPRVGACRGDEDVLFPQLGDRSESNGVGRETSGLVLEQDVGIDMDLIVCMNGHGTIAP